ncbi:MAG TPA: hypothetical protein ENK06_12190 [Gammaproteobacteria bacterium]|nr:hypothetical protein [Gammaproteobacteria bacterium]
MGRVLYEDTFEPASDDLSSFDDKMYREPNSVHLAEDWNTSMEDFIDDFDDYQDLNFPNLDDEY